MFRLHTGIVIKSISYILHATVIEVLSTIQTQWGWSFSLDVVLLASGCNDPSAGGSGSGIYQGKDKGQTYVQTNSHTSNMIIATVPLGVNITGNLTAPKMKQNSTNLVNTTPVKVATHLETFSSNEWSESSNQSYSSLAMLRDYLEVYVTKLLIDFDQLNTLNTTFANNSTFNLTLTTEVTLCQNDFCCVFTVEMIDSFSTTPPAEVLRGDYFSQGTYRLAVFDGVRWYGGGVATGGVQVCGIIPCLNTSLSSCGLRADSSDSTPQPVVGNLYKVSTTFKHIEISASFYYNNTFIFPSVLVTGEQDEFGRLLDRGDLMFDNYEPFNHTALSTLTINKTISNLVTAAVYSRQFDRDGEARTELSIANPVLSSNLVLIIFLIVSHSIYY